MSILGDRLRELRAGKKLSREELARAIDISPFAIKAYELGQREPNSKAMAALEQFFNVSGAYLRGETSEQERAYWEDPQMLSDLQHIDEDLLPNLLSNYRAASDETQFNMRFALAQMNNMLTVNDAEFQKYGSKLLSHFCSIAYDFMRSYQQKAQYNDGEDLDYKAIYEFYLRLLGQDLVEIQKVYFPQSTDPSIPQE